VRDPGDPAQSAAQSGLLAPIIERSPWYLRIPLDAFAHFLASDGWAIASYIAFAVLAAMFPFLILVNWIAGVIGSSDLGVEAGRILLGAWPREVAAPIAGDVQEVQTAVQNAGQSSTVAVSAALAIYFASNGIESLRIGLNRAYDVMETRNWLLLRAESIFYVLVSAISLLVVAVFVVFAPLLLETAARYAHWLEPLDRLGTVSRLGVASTVLVIALVLLHLFLPAGRRRIGQIFPGVVVTIALWLAGGAGFGMYLAQYANRAYVTTYAGLASAMIALVFLYLSAAIFIYGAELNAAILRARHKRVLKETEKQVKRETP
jgi:membrane protein